ncbi:helix-turn-helix transcriptional regulator [Phenylobacterium sp.]|uniref:helix-turn-helix transcriptional regulator n=1 Tax=Phenylobacterium sp. TaxID=1871053 RepID=UPI0035AED912
MEDLERARAYLAGRAERPQRLRTAQVAQMLGVKLQTVEKWRGQGKGPPFVKLGRKLVLYELPAVEAWLRKHERG